MMLTREEQETHIYLSPLEEDASVYTSIKAHANALKKNRLAKYIRAEKIDGEEVGWHFSLPKKAICIRKSLKMGPNLNEQQRQEIANRLHRGRTNGPSDSEL